YQSVAANDPQALVDIVACAESTGAAATGTFTASGTVTANMTHRLWVMGWSVDVSWLVGEAVNDWRDKAIDLINSKATDMFVVASSSANPGEVVLTARSKGPCGNDVRIRVQVLEGAGGAV